LQWKFPKIFKKINDNSPLKITSWLFYFLLICWCEEKIFNI
jgi:hypothetical protein